MRTLKEIHDPRMKISIFSFNEKWIVKCEAGLCEQTFKFPFDEWSMEQVILKLEGAEFRDFVAERFHAMHGQIQNAGRASTT